MGRKEKLGLEAAGGQKAGRYRESEGGMRGGEVGSGSYWEGKNGTS